MKAARSFAPSAIVLDYARVRRSSCEFVEDEPFCVKRPAHSHKPDMKGQARKVTRFLRTADVDLRPGYGSKAPVR